MTRQRQKRRMNFFKNLAIGKEAARKNRTIKANIQIAMAKARRARWARYKAPTRPIPNTPTSTGPTA